MALKTPQQYIDSIREIKPRTFIAGKKIDDVTEHPNTRNVINAVAKTYELALDPRYQEITTATSHLTGEKISRWTHVPRSIDDLEKRRQMNILMAQKYRNLPRPVRWYGRYTRSGQCNLCYGSETGYRIQQKI